MSTNSKNPLFSNSILGDLVLELHSAGCIKFGQFTLKSGSLSPVYFDLRLIIAHPSLMRKVAAQLWSLAQTFENQVPQLVCGVAYTALPIAACIAIDENIPMLIVRKEAKDYGTKKLVEGKWENDQPCLIIEDVIVTGSSLAQTARNLRQEGIRADCAVVLLDRNQGAGENLKKTSHIDVKCLLNLVDMTEFLLSHGLITAENSSQIHQFLNKQNQKTVDPAGKYQTCLVTEPSTPQISVFCPDVNTRLAGIIKAKTSNLCVALDLYTDPKSASNIPIPVTAAQVLAAVDKVGPKVCAVKLHLDTIVGCSQDGINLPKELRILADRHGFLILEDRKLADIGQTVLAQSMHGAWHLGDWCDLVTAHAIPGPGLFDALRRLRLETKKTQLSGHVSPACLVVAEMSSEGSLTDAKYKQSCLDLARNYTDVVAGFVCQHPFSGLSDIMSPSYWVPGVRLDKTGDTLGQSYQSPKQVLGRFPRKLSTTGSESSNLVICIVGRGITQCESGDIEAAAEMYRSAIAEEVT